MGERKGVNKWYPPDYDPSKGGLNKWQGTHALRERAKKIHLGIIIIRFEIPYNIWCEGCGNHIGMGVRYNSEKKKVGMYYTTPIYQFRMKCHLCTNHFEIKTDPANLDYVIVSGARRQEKRFEAAENGTVVPDDKATINKLADDAMFKLEHGEKDADKGKDQKPRISKMIQIQDRVKDDYMANRILRDKMRGPRKKAKEQNIKDQALLKKASLNMKLLPETETDVKMASLLRLNPTYSSEEKEAKLRENITEESIFQTQSTSRPSTSKQKALSDMEKIVHRKKETEVDASPAKSSKSIGVVLKKNIVTKASTSKDINNTNDSSKPTFKTNISLISPEYGENYVTESLPKTSKSIGDVLRNKFSHKATIPNDINITNDSPKSANKSNISLISCEYGDNDEDKSSAKSLKSKGVVLKNDFLPKATTSEDINITNDSPKPASKPSISLIPCEYEENDVDEVLTKTSKSIGVVLKNDFLTKASTSKDIDIAKDSPKSASKPNISLISCDYGSSSSNDEEDA